jgi:hypothetical protein
MKMNESGNQESMKKSKSISCHPELVEGPLTFASGARFLRVLFLVPWLPD